MPETVAVAVAVALAVAAVVAAAEAVLVPIVIPSVLAAGSLSYSVQVEKLVSEHLKRKTRSSRNMEMVLNIASSTYESLLGQGQLMEHAAWL